MGLHGMRYKGIVFDFNGVLFWDADLQVKSWQVIAKNLRGHEMTDDELAIHMHGRPNSYVLSYLAGHSIAGQELLDLIQVKESFYRELCLSNPRRLVQSPAAQSLHATLARRDITRTIATCSACTSLTVLLARAPVDRWR